MKAVEQLYSTVIRREELFTYLKDPVKLIPGVLYIW